MESDFVLLCLMLVTPASAAEHLGFMESIMLSIHQRPWLMGVYVFVVGLPIILFVSFMWPDKRFGPPDQPYYYKKSDDVQPDDPEISPLKKTTDTKDVEDDAAHRPPGLKSDRMRDLIMFLTTGLIITAGFIQFLSASDICHEEVTRLRQQEKILEGRLQKQEFRLRRLELLNRPGNTKEAGDNQIQNTQLSDCSQVFTSGFRVSGLYRIKRRGSLTGVKVYCDMTEGGGWMVIQRRVNGTETFNRSWTEYRDGFGDMSGEFWLGNENLHHITAEGNYLLKINLEDFDGHQRFAEYKNFSVADEKDHYRLTFGAYEGTAGDALSGSPQVPESEWASHQGMKFSTFDQDNDNYRGNCAQEDKGGWWFNKCHSAHLNGVYYSKGHYSASTDDGVVWYPWRGWWYSLKTTIMKLRPVDYKVDSIGDPTDVPQRSPFKKFV